MVAPNRDDDGEMATVVRSSSRQGAGGEIVTADRATYEAYRRAVFASIEEFCADTERFLADFWGAPSDAARLAMFGRLAALLKKAKARVDALPEPR
jgi:hypothetical protein